MNLPPALASWAPFLEEFPIEVAIALGTMANRLAAVLGPLGSEFDQSDGEVDGYDGLTRRGLPERMITSDWLLAQEAPDEWSRRAAEGELSFLQLARKAPQQSKVIGVIFDTGPEVLGAPRLGELALLLVLARRAHTMNTQLLWGVAQRPATTIWKEFTLSGVRSLMESRSAASVTAGDVESWREALSECKEKWFVGGAEMMTLAQSDESLVRFDDPFDESRCIEIMVQPVHQASRNARLELPSDAMCTRLMRDPFDQNRVANHSESRQIGKKFIPVSNPVWIGGNAIAALSKDNNVLAFRVPMQPRVGVPKPKLFHVDGNKTINYVGGWKGSSILAVTSSAEGVYVSHLGTSNNYKSGFYTGDYADNPQTLKPLWFLRSDTDLHPFLLNSEGGLWRIEAFKNTDTATNTNSASFSNSTSFKHIRGNINLIQSGVVAAEGFERGIAVLLTGDVQAEILRIHSDSREKKGFRLLQDDFPSIDADKGFWGGATGFEEIAYGVMAFKDTVWNIVWSEIGKPRTLSVQVPEEEEVMGVIGCKAKWPTPALVVRGAQKRGLRLQGANWKHNLVEDETINFVAVTPLNSCVAWTTSTELVVYSLPYAAVLARWQWKGEA